MPQAIRDSMQTGVSAAMGASSPLHQSLPRLTKKILTLSLYAIVPLALLFYLLSPPPIAGLSSTATSPPNDNHLKGEEQRGARTAALAAARKQQGRKASPAPETRCDYSDGEWVPNAAGPRYNGTSCGATIKDGQNCVVNGRPDTGYMYLRWQPRGCALPPFAPAEFLELVRGRHVAFVGDSLARNQCESLVCLLGSEFPADMVHDGGEERKFRRWAFKSHDATVSVFWSPFLVNGTEKSASPGAGGLDHNRIYFDQPDERWAAEVPGMDVVVLSFGQWFLQPAMYYDRGGAVIGCHHCPEPNRTETGFFGVFRLAVKNALGEVIARSRSSAGREKLAVLTTFSPAHFVGEWDSPDACTRTEPYVPGEMEMSYMHKEMWRTGAEEAAAAARSRGSAVTVEALEVTRLADMRADGHPGPYFHAFPFAGDGGGRKRERRVPNDCVHWCLPGPIDTWNEILLQIVKRWRKNASSSAPPPHDAPP